MSDVDKLLEAFSAGSLLRPSPEFPNIVDLSRAIALQAGAKNVTATAGTETITQLIGEPYHLVFILVDGLGIDLLEKLAVDSFLRSNLSLEINTVFPSSTAVALATIATGEWPNKHAVTGWWTHLPQIRGAATILPFVKRADNRSLTSIGITAENALPARPIMQDMTHDTLTLFPERIAQGVYSIYFSGGKPRQGYNSLSEAFDLVVERVKSSNHPTYTYVYTDRIDTEIHAYGTSNPEIRGALNDMDRSLSSLQSRLGKGSRLVISADHGFLDTFQGQRHQIRSADPLMPLLRFPPSGDSRVLYLHARNCAEGRIRDYFENRFPGRFVILTIEDAESLEIFGPGAISQIVKERMGDLIVISTGADAIEYRPAGSSGKVSHEASQHSGLGPSEMRVPLVIS